MRDNETPRAFHSCCESLVPCINIGDNKLAQWNFLNKLTDSDSQKKAMKMWVSDRLWEDILARIKEDVNVVHNGGSGPTLHTRGRGGGCGRNYKSGRGSHSLSLCFLHRKLTMSQNRVSFSR